MSAALDTNDDITASLLFVDADIKVRNEIKVESFSWACMAAARNEAAGRTLLVYADFFFSIYSTSILENIALVKIWIKIYDDALTNAVSTVVSIRFSATGMQKLNASSFVEPKVIQQILKILI